MRLTLTLKFLLCCLISSALLMVFFGVYPISPGCSCNCAEKEKDISKTNKHMNDEVTATLGVHSLCVLVPFRDRLEELLEFAPHIHSFLNRQSIPHHLYVINQADHHRFNRASLINVGFLETKGQCDYIAMHDVDLLPLNDELKYFYPEHGPFHIASPSLHPRYHYKTFVGGILLLKRDDFEKVNGLSNRYWGWGLEDDEFYVRMKSAGLNISRPLGISTGTKDTFLHLHDRQKRKRDTTKLFNQKQVSRRRDRLTGLSNVNYRLLKHYKINISGAPVNILNVELICDLSQTPWCDIPHDSPKTKPKITVPTQ